MPARPRRSPPPRARPFAGPARAVRPARAGGAGSGPGSGREPRDRNPPAAGTPSATRTRCPRTGAAARTEPFPLRHGAGSGSGRRRFRRRWPGRPPPRRPRRPSAGHPRRRPIRPRDRVSTTAPPGWRAAQVTSGPGIRAAAAARSVARARYSRPRTAPPLRPRRLASSSWLRPSIAVRASPRAGAQGARRGRPAPGGRRAAAPPPCRLPRLRARPRARRRRRHRPPRAAGC